jgi:hypothetical protein
MRTEAVSEVSIISSLSDADATVNRRTAIRENLRVRIA